MENSLYIPKGDVETTNNKLLPEKPGTEVFSKRELDKRIDASELFSHFTANIINEDKVFTR